MEASCRRAIELGLPAIAFSEHADFTPWRPHAGAEPKDSTLGVDGCRLPSNRAHRGDLDMAGYWQSIERCRATFPDLRILSSIELGEPHLFAAEVRAMLHRMPDRLLGSLHCLSIDGALHDLSTPGMMTPDSAAQYFRAALAATVTLVNSDAPFSVLTHIDYAKRYWPHQQLAFDERDFEDDYRAVLRALSASSRALEVNTTRGVGAPRGPCPGSLVLGWWYAEGGSAVSFGSDAHRPEHVAAGFAEAAAMAEAAGFRPAADPTDLWTR